VYLSPQKRGNNLKRDAAQLLAQLNKIGAKVDPAQLGDALMLEPAYAALPLGEVAKLFGAPFAARLPELALKQWQGPVESGYGVHLVYVSARTEGRLPALAEVRDGRAARVGQCPPVGSEREVLPGAAQALHGDR